MARKRNRSRQLQTFKAQCDITGSRLLVYNRNRSIQFEGDLTPQMKMVFAMAGSAKLYFHGYLQGGQICADKILPADHEEDW